MKKLAILIITGLFVSCQLILPPSASSETGHFSFEIPIGCVRDNSESLSLSFAFVNTDEEEELTYTILSLQSIGHQFVTVSIETDVGNYEIRKISIRNEADSIRAISPKVGSNKASLVSSPLPYRFSVFADSTAILSPDMLTFSGSDSPEDYGYSSFAMDVSILYPDFASSLNAFSFDIFREIVSDVDTGNIFISPVSVAYAFGLLYPGVRGTALEEIKDCFYLNDFSQQETLQLYRDFMDYLLTLDDDVDINLAHAFWYRSGWTPLTSYITAVNRYFDCVVSQENFENTQATADTINNWAARNTHDKIKRVINANQIEPAVAILGNATYLKAGWTFDFDSLYTQPDTFICSDGEIIQTDMMWNGTDIACRVLKNDNIQMVRVPLENHEFEIVFLMPFSESPEDMLYDLTAEQWEQWMDSSTLESIRLRIPKYRDRLSYKLKDYFRNLGMTAIFTNPDLSNMFDSGGLSIRDVFHDTYIGVDESGVEAAAVTIIPIDFGIHPPVENYIFNQPFFYVIQDVNTHAILFIGLSRKPEWKEIDS